MSIRYTMFEALELRIIRIIATVFRETQSERIQQWREFKITWLKLHFPIEYDD